MMVAMRFTPILAALVLLAGCSGPSSAPTTPPHATPTSSTIADTYYESVTELRDAVVAIGFTCEAWRQDNTVEMATESGRCSSDDSFSVYSSSSDVASMSDGYDQTAADGSLTGVSGFFGKNWVVLMPTEDADRLESAIGARRLDPPSAEDVLESNYTTAELSYAKAEEADMTDPDEVESAVEEGRDVCASLKGTDAARQAFMILDDEGDYYLDQYARAVKYLCPKHRAAVQLAERGFTDGEYDVSSKGAGDKIRPGTYRTEKGIRDCYWARLTKHGSIIANDFISYASAGARVTIRSGDGGFKADGCGAWLPVG